MIDFDDILEPVIDYNTVELAKTGDADKRMIVVEYGLKANQEAASAALRDLT